MRRRERRKIEIVSEIPKDIEQQRQIDPESQLLDQLVDAHGVSTAKRVLAKQSGYVDVPPTINEFIEDPHYLGDVFNLYPKWQESLNHIYPNEFFSPYLECVLTGAIGLGKTTISLVGTAYDMCKLQHMESPTEYCVLSKTTKLAFAMINANMTLSKAVLMDQVDDIMEQSPYFKQLRAEAMANKSRSKSFLPKNVNVVQGSRFTHVLGQAVIGAVLSELNFQDRVKDQAYDNYTSALTRLQSRFMACKMRTGSYPGRLWLDSSKNDANSFVESHVENNKNNVELLLLDYAFWEVHAHRMNYCGKTFKVFVGDQNRDPFIVEHARQVIGVPDELIIDVPVEHEDRFRQNLPKSLRDIAGKGTWSSAKLISTVERIQQSLRRENPIRQKEIHLDFFDKAQPLINYIDQDKIEADTRPRFIHVDLGLKNDRTGIASTRLDGWITSQHVDPVTLKTQIIKQPLFHTDWVIAIKALPGQEVPIWKIKELIILLRQRGTPIAQVSTDGYQSTNLRQDLLLEGYNCKLLSVDRTKDPYNYFKDCILESRWSGVKHEILEEEIKELVDVGKKIDHPFDGCFVGETQVDTSEGAMPISKVCEEYKRGNNVSIFAYNVEKRERVSKAIRKCWITKETDILVKINVSTCADPVVCTPNHRFMLRDGSYVEAQDLKVGDRLMPVSGALRWDVFVTGTNTSILDEPVPVYDIEVDDYHNFGLSAGFFVHNSKDLADAVCGSIYAAKEGIQQFAANNKMEDYAEVLDKISGADNMYNQIAQNRSR